MSFSDKCFTFPKLNDFNYVIWSIRIKAILVKRGYWSLVSGTEILPNSCQAYATKQFKKRQLEACSELILAVEDSQLAHMDGDDPKVIWDELNKVHVARGLPYTQPAAAPIETKPDQSMSSWIGDVRSLTHQMKHVGITLPDNFAVVVLTSGLSPEYDPVVAAPDAVDPTHDVTVARFLICKRRAPHLSAPNGQMQIRPEEDLRECHQIQR